MTPNVIKQKNEEDWEALREIGKRTKAFREQLKAEILRDVLPVTMVEIVRSFAFKLNVGNYESRDFFCSQKAECRPGDAEMVSEKLYQFCKTQVMKAVAQYKEEAK